MKRRLLRNIARVIIPVLLFNCFGFTLLAAAQAATDGGSEKLALTAAEASNPEINRRLTELRIAAEATPWPAHRPDQIGELLGHDPYAAWAFIRSALRYEPYAGILRGPQGTLAAGGGNSADLALLLQAIIASPNVPKPTRFAIATLSDEAAEALVDLAQDGPPARQAVAARSAAAPRYQLGTPPTVNTSTALERESVYTRALLDNVEADRRLLNALLGPPHAPPRTRAAALRAARQHVWLQVQIGDAWHSFDPAANLTLLPAGVQQVDQLPDDWRYKLRVALQLEELIGAELHRRRLVEKRWTVDTLQGHAIEVMILPIALAGGSLTQATSTPAHLRELAPRFQEFAVSIRLAQDDQNESDAVFALTEEGKATQNRGGAFGFGALDPFGRAKEITSGSKAQFSALWLSIDVKGPGGFAYRVERPLVDRIGMAARASGQLMIHDDWRDLDRARLALVQRHRILVPGGPASLIDLGRNGLKLLLERRLVERALEVRTMTEGAATQAALKELDRSDPPPGLIALNNTALSLTDAAIAGDGIAYLAEPNLYMLSERLRVDDGDQTRIETVLDIAHNAVQVLGEAQDVRAARQLHGLLASELEGQILARSTTGARIAWAAQALRQAHDANIAFVVVRDVSDLDAVSIEPGAKAVMRRELHAGHILIVPEHHVPAAMTAWWRVDADGHVVAIGQNGLGQAEGVMVLKNISIPMVRNTMSFVSCLNKAVAGGGGLQASGGACMSKMMINFVKTTLDNAIGVFVKDPITGELDAARAEMLGEKYEELYQKAKKAYGLYQKGKTIVENAGDSTTPGGLGQAAISGTAPGVSEGQDAAQAGAEIGGLLGFRIYLLLVMGHEIAAYASQL